MFGIPPHDYCLKINEADYFELCDGLFMTMLANVKCNPYEAEFVF
jgi:hypothetical protein